MATAEGRKQNGLTSLYQVLVPWVQRTLAVQYGADWVRNPSITSAMGATGFSSPVDIDKYIRSQTLQAIMVLWIPVFSRILPSSDFDLVRQLHSAERAHLDDVRVDALLDGMATLVTHAQMPHEAARFQRLKKDSGLNVLSKGVEGAALVGGLIAAGYLLYEGARSFMQTDDQEGDSNINNNNINNNNYNNNNNNESNSMNNMRNIDNDHDNNIPPVNANVNDNIEMAEGIGNLNINNNNEDADENTNINSNVNIAENANVNSNTNIAENTNINNNVDDDPPDEDADNPFLCPITLQIMKDPVITPQGICFERQAIIDWIEKAHTCPITQKPLTVDQLITCFALRAAIEEYQKLRNSKGEIVKPSGGSSNPAPPRVQRPVQVQHNGPPIINVEVVPRFRGEVKSLTAAQLRSEDTFTQYPESSKYITFPASKNYVVSRSTGFVVIENRGNFEVTLISRQREGNLWEPANEGGRLCGSYSLGPHQVQGFDYRGWYCIEVPPDLNNRPIDLLVTDYSSKGGGKGAWLRMGTGGPEFRD